MLMIGVKGWFARRSNAAGIQAVGTNALLMNGRNCGMSERLLAPAGVFAWRPNAIVSHVSDTVTPAKSAAEASRTRAGRPLDETEFKRNGNDEHTADQRSGHAAEHLTVSTDVRVMAIVRKRAMMPSFMSMQTLMAVPAAAAPAVITRMPGAR